MEGFLILTVGREDCYKFICSSIWNCGWESKISWVVHSKTTV